LECWCFKHRSPLRSQDKKISDKDLTCQTYGGTFVLDDSDFKALEKQKITREKFVALAPTSKVRMAICDTRKLWRVIKTGNADHCDWDTRYVKWDTQYYAESELNTVINAQINAMAGVGTKCR
jgi:hypothetical protein